VINVHRAKPQTAAPARVLLGLLAALAVLLAGAPGASAESPWWHLTSGSRPTYLRAGAGHPGADETQEILVSYEGLAAFELKVGETGLGLFAFPEEFAGEVGLPAMNAANIQAALEGPYGAGKVTVTEEVGAETISFKVSSPAGVTALSAESLIGEVKTKITSPGTPAAPDGEIYMTAENLGDANAEGSPVIFTDTLPKGLKATGVAATKPHKEGNFNEREALPCSLAEKGGAQTATCTLEEPLVPYDQLEMRISVQVQPGAKSGESNEVSISGGGAQGSSLTRPITISEAPVPFGVEGYEMALEEEGGAAVSQAGAHPFQLNTTITLNQLRDINPLHTPNELPEVSPPALAKDLNFKLPPGLIGNPTPIAQCSTKQFFETVGARENRCPAASAVGVATVTVHEPHTVGTVIVTEPVFNLEPRVGEPARFGFYVVIANSPVFIDTSVRSGSDYGVTVTAQNITQTAAFLSSEVTFWGVPGDSRHDAQRGWGCLFAARGAPQPGLCTPSGEAHPPPFLSLPTSCSALSTSVEGDSWSEPGDFFQLTGAFEPSAPLSGCNRLQFAPQIKVAPDAQQASKPTGLSVDVHVPQEVNENAQGFASSNVKAIEVAFPQGVAVNPAAADGLEACSEGLVGLLPGLGEQGETLFTPALPEPLLQGQNFCPDAAKIGDVSIRSPLLPKGQPVEGSLYLASPAPNKEAGKNPFDALLAMYIIARDPVSGTLVKLPGKATLDPATGQLTARFDNNPQLAFEDAEIHLFGGERAPLTSPAHCGAYTTNATFTPWSGAPPVGASSSFQITSGPNGGPCPPASLPFSPSLTGGMSNINAGSFGPLTTTISREDGQQDIKAVSLRMPAGLSGILKGLTLCSEADADAGSCPQSSEIGKTIVSVGVGADPFSVQGGKVFFTESYKGAPFGLSIVNPAVAGPFDLGKVIVRAKVDVDPRTAALTVSTDESGPYSIPRILDGIPLQIKRVAVEINRQGFTFNPTSCDPQAITGAIESAEGAKSPVATPFQVTNCANLKFAPNFKVSTAGATSKANGASLNVKLTYPKAPAGVYANIAKVKVSLPKQLPSRLTTLQKACAAPVFEAGPAKCPKESIVGQAKVLTQLLPTPLTGPAYFVSHGGEAFPDLTIVLKGQGQYAPLTVDLIGSTQIKNGVTTSTFKATPDVPFESFELNLPQGKYSALAANANLCKSKLRMPSEFTAQNGMLKTQRTKISVTGCKKPKITRAQRLAKALKACRKTHDKAKRKSCEAQARRRFSAKAKRKKR